MRLTLDDYAEARRPLWAALAQNPIADDGRAGDSYHHDHDEELGVHWYGSPDKQRLEQPLRKDGDDLYDLDYWLKTASLVREYLRLRAGAAYSDTLHQDLKAWLQASPERRHQYEKGDDMRRAALVDGYLKVAR